MFDSDTTPGAGRLEPLDVNALHRAASALPDRRTISDPVEELRESAADRAVGRLCVALCGFIAIYMACHLLAAWFGGRL